MKKSEVVASCLVNSGMFSRLEEAENAVRRIFSQEFPGDRFENWDQSMDAYQDEQIMKNVGRASRINVRKFIEDLW